MINPGGGGSVVYITSSRRTVQLGYTQGVYERFPIPKVISILQQLRPDYTGDGLSFCSYSMQRSDPPPPHHVEVCAVCEVSIAPTHTPDSCTVSGPYPNFDCRVLPANKKRTPIFRAAQRAQTEAVVIVSRRDWHVRAL